MSSPPTTATPLSTQHDLRSDFMRLPVILVFDSGLGGLTVFREIAKMRPDARYIYVADDAFFPYGRHGEADLINRIVPLMGKLITTYQPDLVVIACNTASTLVLPYLRANYSVPFVGTVPAIKPACILSKTKQIAVLGTEATIARDYTKALVRDFAQGCGVKLVGSARLASLAEAALRGEPIEDVAISEEIAPCFVDDGGRRTDTIVLACTHFPLLLEHFVRLSPWAVQWIDPAPAIARRVCQLIGPSERSEAVPARAVFTAGRALTPSLKAVLAQWGIRDVAVPDTGHRFDLGRLSS